MKKRHFLNKFAAMSLGLSLALSAGLGMAPTFAHAASATSDTAQSIISTGEQFMGVPYHFGAKSGRTDEFDCSSFVQYVYKQNGINLPRSSRQQATAGTFVSKDQLQPGDLVFFYSPIHHVAIYIGNGKILHTYGKPGVTISNLNSGWWSTHYETSRRVLSTNGQAVNANTSVAPKSTVNHTSAPNPITYQNPYFFDFSNFNF